MSVLTLWRHTQPAVTGSVIRPTCLSKTNHWPWNGYSRHIKVVCNGLVSHSGLNHTHRLLMVILTEPWHRRSCENSNFQNGKLFTFVDSTINDRRWFKCLIRSSQTRSWDGKFTLWNFSVTEHDVIVCFVRINAFHAIIFHVNYNKQLFWS